MIRAAATREGASAGAALRALVWISLHGIVGTGAALLEYAPFDQVWVVPAFAALGFVLGGLQTVVLGLAPLRSALWAGLTGLGLVLGTLVFGAVFGALVGVHGDEGSLGFAVAALAGGAQLGLLQAFAVRERVHPLLWIGAQAAGFLIGVLVFLSLSRGADARGLASIAAGALGGAAFGLPTAVVLALPGRRRPGGVSAAAAVR